ncbi:STAS domain-containing protein [Actinokineospora globicatena]|uniref:Anti-sigma factor antagonist n=1 Tax=Actinokineospora globicatena TaxID=103729 RepID=A0A9W6V716_9PSEU|nr:STAS domain-containing protein [Actinokineospora globicatena]MCP2304314.1 anti-sigma B factor antagonist [Actinokineospora globicatena]GLW78324.1 anti-sigma F factor antagonist [Actinokineospora globicatena]GLW85012.1 anti-sigma F factor antagonist [Actinokineospora globicatena]GLW90932.1 anti-sigma F factor antagonist [Actinokineospora globicatena]
MTAFAHTTKIEQDRATISVTGELDTHTSIPFKQALLALADTHAEVVVDLANLEFIDSSGLSAFIAAHKRTLLNGNRVLLDQVPPFLSRILAITGLVEIIQVLGAADTA